MAESLSDDEPGDGVVATDVYVVSNRQPYRHEYDGWETARGGTADGRAAPGVTVPPLAVSHPSYSCRYGCLLETT